jgi:hypothetical protein
MGQPQVGGGAVNKPHLRCQRGDETWPKASQTNQPMLELFVLVISSGLMLLAAFSTISKMEMDAREPSIPIEGGLRRADHRDSTSHLPADRMGRLDGAIGQAAFVRK